MYLRFLLGLPLLGVQVLVSSSRATLGMSNQFVTSTAEIFSSRGRTQLT
jgi:hypothetical protein